MLNSGLRVSSQQSNGKVLEQVTDAMDRFPAPGVVSAARAVSGDQVLKALTDLRQFIALIRIGRVLELDRLERRVLSRRLVEMPVSA